MNLEFALENAPVVFHVEELDLRSRDIHERAIRRAQKYLVSEGELLESIIEVDQHKLYIGGGRVQIVLNLSEEEFDLRCRIKDLVSQSLGKAATDSEVEVAMMIATNSIKTRSARLSVRLRGSTKKENAKKQTRPGTGSSNQEILESVQLLIGDRPTKIATT